MPNILRFEIASDENGTLIAEIYDGGYHQLAKLSSNELPILVDKISDELQDGLCAKQVPELKQEPEEVSSSTDDDIPF